MLFLSSQGTWQFMSAMLLMSLKPPVHTLAYNLESFLHVLSWVALRFTSHDLDSKALTDLLTTMFDHSYQGEDGSARGGLSKKNYLLGGEVPKIGFRQPILQKLLEDLTTTLAVRYEGRPPDGRRAEQDDEQRQLNILLTNRYKRRLAAIQSSDWMLDMFTKAVANRNIWSQHDKSVENRLSYKASRGRKRKSDNFGSLPRQRQRFSSPPILESSDEECSGEGWIQISATSGLFHTP